MKDDGLGDLKAAKNAWKGKAAKISRQLQAKFTTVSGDPGVYRNVRSCC
jgi:hypothetical protein